MNAQARAWYKNNPEKSRENHRTNYLRKRRANIQPRKQGEKVAKVLVTQTQAQIARKPQPQFQPQYRENEEILIDD